MAEERDARSNEQIEAVDRIRSSLASGFSFVRSREMTASIAAITFEECVAAAIDDIEVDESDIRRSKLTEVRAIRQEVVDAVEQAQRMPPEVFATQDGQGAANTDVEGDGPQATGEEGEVET
jgi:hypothetical protein